MKSQMSHRSVAQACGRLAWWRRDHAQQQQLSVPTCIMRSIENDVNSVFINDPNSQLHNLGCDRQAKNRDNDIVTAPLTSHDAVGLQACLDVDVGTACKKVV